MIYLHENGITIIASDNAKRGKVYEFNGEKYYVARGLSDIKKIIKSKQYPLNRVITSKLTSLNGLFQIQAHGKAAVPTNFNDDISNWDTSNVLSMEEVFSGWPKFNQNISYWNTSKVKSMYGMFKSSKYEGNYYMGKTSFNQDISNWDVSNVTNMSEMFLGATSFNQPLGNWDVSNVEEMDYMFSGAKSFNQDINNWDTSKVKSMSGMFSNIVSIGKVGFVGTLDYFKQDYTSFNQPIGNWNVSKVEYMDKMFSGAKYFNQEIGSWDVSNVVEMDYMFSDAKSFNKNLNEWNTKSLYGVKGMFYGASSFNSPIDKWKTNSITNMLDMFREAKSFNQDISCWDVSNVAQMKGLFQDAFSFNQNISEWKLNEALPKSLTMFKGAKAFNLKEYNPFSKRKKTTQSTVNLSTSDKKVFSKIKKLLLTRDCNKIDLGLELLISIENKEIFETLLKDCKINSYNIIERNKMFSGSGPAQPFLDYALINLIANAPENIKVDRSILIENITSLNISYNYPRLIPIENFIALTSLEIEFPRFNNFIISENFKNMNIVDLHIKNVNGSVKWLKNFTNLKVLNFDLSYNGSISDPENFKYLINLEKLIFSSKNFKNLDFLGECKNIKKLHLKIYYDSVLENIDFLNKLNHLEYLMITGLDDKKYEDFKMPVLSSKSLKKIVIDISYTSHLKTLKNCTTLEELTIYTRNHIDFKTLNNCTSLKKLNLLGSETYNIYGNISDISGLKGLNSLKYISINNINFLVQSDDVFLNETNILESSIILNDHKNTDLSNYTHEDTSHILSHDNDEDVKDLSLVNKSEINPEHKKSFAKIKKLLLSRDLDKIDLGLELLISLENNELYEIFLNDCKLISTNTHSELIRNKFFKGSRPAQPYLDYALINIIANASDKIKKDKSLLIKNISFFNSNILNLRTNFTGIPRFLPIHKFTSLLSLILDFSDYNLDNVLLEDVFINASIVDLNVINVTGSLKWLKNFSRLKVMKFEAGYNVSEPDNFKYLINLERLEFSSKNLKNLDFLGGCKQLKILNLNIDLVPDNFNFLKELVNLEVLTISFNDNTNKIDFSALLYCNNIEELSINFDWSGEFDFKLLKNCNSLKTLNIRGLKNKLDICGKSLQINNFNNMNNLKELQIEDIKIINLDCKSN